MRDKILSVIKELGFATFDEIKSALGDESRKKTVEDNLAEAEREGEVLMLLPEENTFQKEGYIPGPNLEVDDNLEIRRLLTEKGFSERRDVVKWDALVARLVSELKVKIDGLTVDIDNLYKSPKDLELEYFDYALRYHELYRLFNERVDIVGLKALNELLINCRSMLDKLNYKGTP